jgi:hypothetical protein
MEITANQPSDPMEITAIRPDGNHSQSDPMEITALHPMGAMICAAAQLSSIICSSSSPTEFFACICLASLAKEPSFCISTCNIAQRVLIRYLLMGEVEWGLTATRLVWGEVL